MSVAVRGELLRYLTPSMHLQNDFANVTTTIKREAPNLLAARDALRALQRKQACSGGGPIRCSAIVMQRTSTLLVQAVGGRVAHQGRSGRRLDLVVQCRADACEGGARNLAAMSHQGRQSETTDALEGEGGGSSRASLQGLATLFDVGGLARPSMPLRLRLIEFVRFFSRRGGRGRCFFLK